MRNTTADGGPGIFFRRGVFLRFGVLFVLGLLGLGGAAFETAVLAQETIFDPLQPRVRTRGLFGDRELGTMPKPSDMQRTRFDSGFRFDDNGYFLGMDTNRPGNLFRPGWANEPESILNSFPENYGDSTVADPADEINRPLVGATGGSQRSPTRRPVDYYDRADVRWSDAVQAAQPATEPIRTETQSAQGGPAAPSQWFRNPFDGGSRGVQPILPRRQTLPPGQAPAPGPAGAVGAVGARPLSTTEALDPLPATAVAPMPMSPAEQSMQARRRIRLQEERLEAVLLGHASIHALSPIQVSLAGTTATVRGVVADQRSRLAVGSVLLGDPAIKQVNNLTTVLSDDPNQRPEPIDAK